MNTIQSSLQTAETTSEAEQDGALDVRELLALVLGSWPLITAIVIAALAIGRYVVFITAPTYQTDALVQVESSPNAAAVAIGEITQNIAPGLPRDTEIALLRSRSVLGTVVERLGLDVIARPKHLTLLGQPLGAAVARNFREPGFGSTPAWLAPFADSSYAWGGESIVVPTFSVPDGLVGTPFSITAGTNGAYRLALPNGESISGEVGRELRVPARELTGDFDTDLVLFVRELRGRPGTAFEVRRILAENAIARIQAGFSTVENKASGIITLRFEGNDPHGVTQVLGAILRTYQVQNIERRSEQAEKTLSFLLGQLPELRERVEVAEAQLNSFRIERGTADLEQETAALLERSLSLEEQLSTLRQQREESLQRFTLRHPVVMSLDAQIQQVASQAAEIDARVAELPDVQQQALALQREVELGTTLYTELLNRRQEIEMVRAGTTGSIRIIDSPLVPRRSIAPDTTRIMLGSLFAGFAVGIGLVLGIALLRSGIEDPSKVEAALNLPTYGSVPYSSLQQRLANSGQKDGQSDSALLAELEPESITIEAVRSLRTALRFAQFDAPDNITMLTSPSPGVGKSFLSINLAALIAKAGERVVVIDADMRRGYLHKTAGIDRGPGLSELISGTESLEATVHKLDTNNLYLIPTGTLPPNPSELLINDSFLKVLETLSQHFDQVILDTPPILAVTDAADIGRHCGTCLVVLKAGAHTMRMIDDTANRLRRAGVRVRGTVFNQVGRTSAARYGYGYGYYGSYYYSGYRYQYGAKAPSWTRTFRAAGKAIRKRLS